jgi:hypothetical protein
MTTTTTVPSEINTLINDTLADVGAGNTEDDCASIGEIANAIEIHVIPAVMRMVCEHASQELEAYGKKVADEAAYKVAAGDDGGFSGVLRGASISWAAKFVRGEVTV